MASAQNLAVPEIIADLSRHANRNGGGGGPTDEHGLTIREEAFARHVAEGHTQSEAYRCAYDASNMKPSSVWREAHAVACRAEVRERIAVLRDDIRATAIRDAGLAQEVVAECLLALVGDDLARPRDRLKAAELILSWIGAFKDQPKVRSKELSEREIKDRIDDLLIRASI